MLSEGQTAGSPPSPGLTGTLEAETSDGTLFHKRESFTDHMPLLSWWERLTTLSLLCPPGPRSSPSCQPCSILWGPRRPPQLSGSALGRAGISDHPVITPLSTSSLTRGLASLFQQMPFHSACAALVLALEGASPIRSPRLCHGRSSCSETQQATGISVTVRGSERQG